MFPKTHLVQTVWEYEEHFEGIFVREFLVFCFQSKSLVSYSVFIFHRKPDKLPILRNKSYGNYLDDDRTVSYLKIVCKN